jgi:hypothetical protein
MSAISSQAPTRWPTSWNLLLIRTFCGCSVYLHGVLVSGSFLLYDLVKPSFLSVRAFLFSFLAQYSLEIFGPPVSVLGVVWILEWSWIVKIGELLC